MQFLMDNYKIRLYKVGGCVRDELIGLKPKDIDYTVVIEKLDNENNGDNDKDKIISVEEGFDLVEKYLVSLGYTIFLKTPSTFTLRAKNNSTKETADFVLARHELYYNENSREPISVIGTLEQDLLRRDFTINAMARDDLGNLIDLFEGQEDLENKILRTPLEPIVTMLDDPLRIFRAFRFAITKDLEFDSKLSNGFKNKQIYEKLWVVVSPERIREELHKMFSFNTFKSLELLIKFSDDIKQIYPNFLSDLFEKTGLWLKPTSEKR